MAGFDQDPESLQRDRNGDLWMGDEFGLWIVHFDATGRLLEAPYGIDVKSPSNRFLGGQPVPSPNSRGFEGMAICPKGKLLYAALQGPKVTDSEQPTTTSSSWSGVPVEVAPVAHCWKTRAIASCGRCARAAAAGAP